MAEDTGQPVYHICRRDEWRTAVVRGSYPGSTQDRADGFIHFSSAVQVRGSAAKHRAGQANLVLLSVDPNVLGDSLKWEPSRAGQLFPHLYGELPLSAVIRMDDLPLDDRGVHVFPNDIEIA